MRKGFTLIELMIIVAIVGILMSIAVPAFMRASRGNKPRPDTEYTSYKLQNGEVVQCAHKVSSQDTMDLSDCKDGNKYLNQTNLTVLGSGYHGR